METDSKTIITIETDINAPLKKTWEYFTNPEHVTKWNHASDDWHSPKAENDFRKGGIFSYRMEAKDGSFGFDFGGVYDEIVDNKYIEYTLGDGRKVKITFEAKDNSIHIIESFEAETTNSIEMQKGGWQSILDNFKKYAEANQP